MCSVPASPQDRSNGTRFPTHRTGLTVTAISGRVRLERFHAHCRELSTSPYATDFVSACRRSTVSYHRSYSSCRDLHNSPAVEIHFCFSSADRNAGISRSTSFSACAARSTSSVQRPKSRYNSFSIVRSIVIPFDIYFPFTNPRTHPSARGLWWVGPHLSPWRSFSIDRQSMPTTREAFDRLGCRRLAETHVCQGRQPRRFVGFLPILVGSPPEHAEAIRRSTDLCDAKSAQPSRRCRGGGASARIPGASNRNGAAPRPIANSRSPQIAPVGTTGPFLQCGEAGHGGVGSGAVRR